MKNSDILNAASYLCEWTDKQSDASIRQAYEEYCDKDMKTAKMLYVVLIDDYPVAVCKSWESAEDYAKSYPKAYHYYDVKTVPYIC